MGGGIMAAGEILLGVARDEAGRRALRPPGARSRSWPRSSATTPASWVAAALVL